MVVTVNANPFPLDHSLSIAEFILKFEIQGKFAIELNREIIPRSLYDSTQLQDGDELEIVGAIGGG